MRQVAQRTLVPRGASQFRGRTAPNDITLAGDSAAGNPNVMPIGFVKRCSKVSIAFLNPLCALCLRAYLSCNVIGDQHGQCIVGDFPLTIDQFDHSSAPTMT